jgi:plasmid replication initiation protein
MDNLDSSSKNPTVVKSNSLIQAGYRLTLAEQRVLLSAIAQIGKDDQPTDQTMYSVTANALADLTGAAAQQAYRDLASAAHRLYRREVRIEGGPNGESEGPRGRVTMTRWVQTIHYVPDEGRIEMRFATDILPYLSMLQREFTSYKLRHVATMKSTHGVRLYELLAQWRQAGEREIEIGEIRRMFGVENQYPSIADLKKRVIEPAVRDVNECSDLNVEWGQRKAGRKIAAIQFKFKPKKQPKPEPESDKLERRRDGRISRAEIEHAARPGESEDDVIRRLEGRERRSNAEHPQPTPEAERRDAPEKVAHHLEAMRAAAKGAGDSDGE